MYRQIPASWSSAEPAVSHQGTDVAAKMLGRSCRDPSTGLPTLAYYQDTFYRYLNGRWTSLSNRQLRSHIVTCLTGVRVQSENPNLAPYLVPTTPGTIESVVNALPDLIGLDSTQSTPIWLGPGTHPTNPKTTIATLDYLVDLSSDLQVPRTIEWFDSIITPTYYRPEAQCPAFDLFLRQNGTGPDWEELLLRFLAYCLVVDRSFHVFFVLGTASRSGKTTLDELQSYLLGGPTSLGGGYEQRKITSFSASDHATAGLERARLLSILETQDLGPSHLRVLQGELLRFVGDSTISVNRKFHDVVVARHQLKVKLTGNVIPPIEDPGNSLWRKAIVIPFNRSLEEHEIDRNFTDRLTAEASGIMNLIVPAGRRLFGSRPGAHWPRLPEAIEMLKAIREDANSVAAFLDECCSKGGATLTDVLYAAYLEWCRTKGQPSEARKTFVTKAKTAWGLQPYQHAGPGPRLRGLRGCSLR